MKAQVARGPATTLARVFLVMGLLQPLRGREAHAAPEEVSGQAHVISVARDLMSAARYSTFVTLDAQGQPQARIVDPLPPEAGLSVYVATNPLSRKVNEILKDPRVTLLYFDAARPGYVTLIGRAVLVTGAEKQAHHKKEWQSFFPREKPETYTLYRIVPSRLEVVSAKDGLGGDPLTWRPAIVELK
jgi:general stress protein 26